MIELTVKNFEVYTECEFQLIGKLKCACNKFSYTFKSGIYALSGEINQGGWAFVYSLLPVKKYIFYSSEETEYILNDKNITLSELQKQSCYVGDISIKTFSRRNLKLTVRELISKALKNNKSIFSTDDIQKMFNISDDRINRKINSLGYETFRATAAIGIASNKKIFCFPWLDSTSYSVYLEMFKQLFTTLKQLECLVLVPITDANILKGIHDIDLNLNNLSREQNIRNRI